MLLQSKSTKRDKKYKNRYFNMSPRIWYLPAWNYNSKERQIIMDKDNMKKVINLCKKAGYQVEIKE